MHTLIDVYKRQENIFSSEILYSGACHRRTDFCHHDMLVLFIKSKYPAYRASDAASHLPVSYTHLTPADAKKARELGAEGIGLCRTEHMFFDPERIAAVSYTHLDVYKRQVYTHLFAILQFLLNFISGMVKNHPYT